MTHEAETDIEPQVADWFRERYGDESVEVQSYQPDPLWYADIRVDAGWCTLYVEVENNADAVRPGVSQALGYAAQSPESGVPMVVTPKGHVDQERADRLRLKSSVLIREFDGETGEFV